MSENGKITRIQVEGFKSIKELDLQMRPGLTVLIGANGAGKSNFLSFFKFMNKLATNDLKFYVAEQGGANKFLYFVLKKNSQINIKIEISELKYTSSLYNDLNERLLFFREEFYTEKTGLLHLSFSEDNLDTGLLQNSFLRKKPSGIDQHYDSMDKILDERPWKNLAELFSKWSLYNFIDTTETAKVKYKAKTDNNRFLRFDASNLAPFLRFIKIRHPKEYGDIVYTVSRGAPFFQDFILEPDAINPDYIALRWKHVGTDEYFDAHDLSDGTLRFICLATVLLQPEPPPTIIIDEPELGLHPYALELLGGLMRSVSAKTQLIVATQSERLINKFDVEDLIVVDREDNASVFRRLNKEEFREWLEQYGSGDLWVKNIIGGNP